MSTKVNFLNDLFNIHIMEFAIDDVAVNLAMTTAYMQRYKITFKSEQSAKQFFRDASDMFCNDFQNFSVLCELHMCFEKAALPIDQVKLLFIQKEAA